jgi:hypothetical protein
MRRTIFVALVAALLLVPAAAHAATDPMKIVRDCADDGVLQGNYSVSDLRKASNDLPTDVDEYSDCSDVLSRAIANASGSDSGGAWEPNAGTSSGGTGGGSTDDGGGTPPTTTGSDAPKAAETATPVPTPPPDDKTLLAEAAKSGDKPVVVDGRPVSPGSSRLVAEVGRNSVPGTTIGVLALICFALLTAMVLPLLRRRRGGAGPEA